MAKTKISEFNANPALNTDIDSINISEGCAPSGINDAIRELMSQLKDWQAGTSNDPMVIGSSGSLTLNQGTANGIAYLNGSKVVTSGSVLTFDGSTTTFSGGVSVFSNNNFYMQFQRGSTVYGYLGTGSNTAGGAVTDLGIRAENNMVFAANGTEQMRLTSTGLGIGTSSPSYKLDVNGNAQIGNATAATNRSLFINGVANKAGRIIFQESGVDKWYIGNGAASENGNFEIYNANGNNTVLTPAGNLGLGVTPSANNGVRTLIVADQGGTLNSLTLGAKTGGYGEIGYGFGFNGSAYKYLISDSASKISFNAGGIQFSNAPSGTAGTAITFTQALTLDSGGNLFLGATSQAYAEKFRMSGNYAVFENGTYTGFIGAGISMGSGTNTDFGIRSNAAIAFLAGGGTERARIDSSGNFLVNTTSTVANVTVSDNTAGNAYYMGMCPASTVGLASTAKNDYALQLNRQGNTDGAIAGFRRNGSQVGYISVTGSATAYNTSSDYRLKNSVAPMAGALAKVAQLKPCTYKWNSDGSDGQGFIAHELAEVVPQCVTGEKDAVDEEGNPKYQGIDTSFLVATLTAAIQELKAEFDAYKASHT